jgi:hypothetical protein
MNRGRSVFAQLLDFVPFSHFEHLVDRYASNHGVRHFSAWSHLLCIMYAQLTRREGLRDLVACLNSQRSKLYHLGIRGKISRSTLADANERRDWRVFEALGQRLIATAVELYHDQDSGLGLKEPLYALDSTTIDLCLTLFPWADFRSTKAAVKAHTIIDLRGVIPVFVHITTGKVHDVRILDQLRIEPGAIYNFDRGYIDFARLHRIHLAAGFFVTRAKNNFRFQRLYSQPVRSASVRCDQVVVPRNFYARRDYPSKLRRILYVDPETQKTLVFLTNNFTLPPETVAALYRCRWQVELFFKWIKQHLRIKAFYGTTENAVKTQIWIAITVYVLVAIVKKKLKLDRSLYTILQILSVAVFEKTPLDRALASTDCIDQNCSTSNQLQLFD